jgi:NAD(P)H-dependent FMN reductase
LKVIAFSTSSSRDSINKKLATYAASLIDETNDGTQIEILDLNDYEIPLFSVDREAEIGQAELAKQFLAKIAGADLLVVSTAEHNGNFPAAWKNLFDWCTRIEKQVFQDTPMILLSTSPGGRGGATVMDIALNAFPRFGTEIKAHLSIPNFNDHYDEDTGKLTGEYKSRLLEAIGAIKH